MRIFLIAGRAESGKGEVARLIKEYYIYKLEECAITSYSKYIKNFALELTDWDGTDANKPREFMQKLGDVMREIDENYLVNNMIKDISVFENYVQNLVISDVRMPNEIEEIKENYENVYAIYVVNQFSTSSLTTSEQSHITETALESYDEFDYTLANDGSLDDLKTKVFAYLDGLQ